MSRIPNFFVSFSLGIKKIMKKILLKSKKTIESFTNLEYKRVILKSIFSNKNFIKTTRWNNVMFLTKFKLGITKTTKRCLLSNRKNIFDNNYKISRIIFLNCARQGLISGLIRST